MSSDQELPNPPVVDTSIPKSYPKRIIICCDGTWQSSVSGLKNVPSNITRLSRNFARAGRDKNGNIWQQLVHYDAGIATGELSKKEASRQGDFGIGFVGNVIESYNFIVNNYSPGDQIMCFGFSRGAYTARAVAGLVTDIGIISPRDMQDFPDLFALYQQNKDSHGFRKSSAYRDWVHGVKAKVQPPTGGPVYDKPAHADSLDSSRIVEVVGVFDTVGSLGIPDLTWTKWNLKWLEDFMGIPKAGFHNVALSPYINHAFHALALDEHRGPFTPTLWHVPTDSEMIPRKPTRTREEIYAEYLKTYFEDDTATENEKEIVWKELVNFDMYEQLKDSTTDLSQVWFPGVHVNIGGGNESLFKEEVKGDMEQLAVITYAWMVEQVSPYVQFVEDLYSLGYDTVTDRKKLIHPVLDRFTKGEVKNYGTNWFMQKASQFLNATGLKPAEIRSVADSVVHGWATGPIVDSYTGSMVIAGSITRTPGQYLLDENKKPLGPTNESIHPCVAFRMSQVSDYKPDSKDKPLYGYKRRARASKTEGYEWYHEKMNITLPEYIIKPGDMVTRVVARQDSNTHFGNKAMDFIGGIDEDIGAVSTEEAVSLQERKSGNI